jgi:hypothetical protein
MQIQKCSSKTFSTNIGKKNGKIIRESVIKIILIVKQFILVRNPEVLLDASCLVVVLVEPYLEPSVVGHAYLAFVEPCVIVI